MTNTLHRCGSEDSLRDDFIVFAIPSRGLNDDNVTAKQKRFLELALKFQPVNIGDARHGALHAPSHDLNPSVHWRRPLDGDPDAVLASISGPTTVAAVFDRRENATAFLAALKEAAIGLSINISSSIDGARDCAARAGLTRHSVEYSLGFRGQTDRLADRRTLELSTMCGHGMLSFDFVRKMTEWVKQGRRSPEQASITMARFCSCGVFNTRRACRLLEEARGSGR